MIHLVPLAIVAVLVLSCVWLWRRTTQRRAVQVYVGDDERSRGAAVAPLVGEPKRYLSVPGPERKGDAGSSPVDCSPLLHFRALADPLHFRILRRLGVECRRYDRP